MAGLMVGTTDHLMFNRIRLELQRHGLRRTLYKIGFKAATTLLNFKILRGIIIERCDPTYLECPEGYNVRLLSKVELENYSSNPEIRLPRAFLEAALEKGDECLGICHGNELVSYGWYAFGPTPIDPPDLVLQFSHKYAYMYHCFTSVPHRGKRLFAVAIARALQLQLAKGCKGLVSYIEANNFDSLKSSFRIGYRQFGSIYVVRLFGRYFIHSSRGCRKYDFALRPIEGGSARPIVPHFKGNST
jgi:hypothetical protein